MLILVRRVHEAIRQKRELHMHDFLVAGAFLLMVVLPCIVTMGAGTDEEGEEG